MRTVAWLAGAGASVAAAALAWAATPVTASASTASAPAAAAAPAAPDTGFSYGTDSWPVTISGRAPYQEPVIGGSYGGYVGMAGNWARQEGCKTGNFLAWAPANAGQANANYKNSGIGVGTGVYWYMGGPGVDPHYNGGTTEAFQWGKQQAAWTLAGIRGRIIPYPVIWADIELPGIAPAPDNGWNSVYTAPCSGAVRASSVAAVLDRSVLNGYGSYLTSHSTFKLGVYSSPLIWPSIFGTGAYARLPATYEWTYSPETASLGARPSGWCLGGSAGCAQFFGGQTPASRYAVMWQWSGGGGVRNAYGDFDQIDVARLK